MKTPNVFRTLSIAIVSAWLAIFVLTPFVMVLITSILTPGTTQLISLPFTFHNYQLIGTWLYIRVFFKSLILAGVCTTLCLLIAYPFAFIVSRVKPTWRPLLLLGVIIPFWTSSMIRTYAIMTLLKAHGVFNTLLMHLHLIERPLQLLYSDVAVYVGLVYTLLPFMILPLYANLEKLDPTLIEAARSLGANRYRTITRVIIPASFPGIMAGILMVFLPAMTLFYIPDILGGAKSLYLGNLIQMQLLSLANWPAGAATSLVLIFLLSLLLIIYQRIVKDRKREKRT